MNINLATNEDFNINISGTGSVNMGSGSLATNEEIDALFAQYLPSGSVI